MFAVDLDSLTIVQSVTARSPLARIIFTHRNQRKIGLQFYRGTTVVELPEDATGEILIKASGQPDSSALARATTWTKEGSGATAVYYFLLDLNTDEMGTAFSENPDSITALIFELTFIESGNIQTPPRISCTVYNRYLQQDENLPSPADPDYPAAGVILVTTEQVLSDEAKNQALENLGINSTTFRITSGGPELKDATTGNWLRLVVSNGQIGVTPL
jgi:hypothetical protein